MSDTLVERDVLQRVIGSALERGGEFAEVFVEDRSTSSAMLDQRRVEELSSGRDRGAGVRVVVGDTTGFAHTADLSESSLLVAAQAAASVAREGGGGVREVALGALANYPTHASVLPGDVDKAKKIELLRHADDVARSEGSSITQVQVALGDSTRRFVVANSDGVFAQDHQVRTRFNISCIATGDTGMQTGYRPIAGTRGFEILTVEAVGEAARGAARQAITKLDARPAPSGDLPVVLAGGSGGILFHEACGHGLEADHILKDASVFRGQMGTQVASPLVTLVDDGGYAHEWGTLAIDDEGHAARRNVLIEDGMLTDYMWDVVRARKEGRAPSGNGRRESYRHLPMPRMTNTFVLEGESDPDDIIRSVDFGIYAVQLGGGQVDPATGDFVFGITEAYLIEKGEITQPIRAAQLIGNGPEVLRMVDAVGNDFDTWTGMCGKQGQSVPVSSGQPTVLVREITVGGTAA